MVTASPGASGVAGAAYALPAAASMAPASKAFLIMAFPHTFRWVNFAYGPA